MNGRSNKLQLKACEAMVARFQERYPGQINYRKVPADAPEAADFGVVMPPMLLLDDMILCAGKVPVESGLAQLLANELRDEATV